MFAVRAVPLGLTLAAISCVALEEDRRDRKASNSLLASNPMIFATDRSSWIRQGRAVPGGDTHHRTHQFAHSWTSPRPTGLGDTCGSSLFFRFRPTARLIPWLLWLQRTPNATSHWCSIDSISPRLVILITLRVSSHELSNQNFPARMCVNSSTTSCIGSSKKPNRA